MRQALRLSHNPTFFFLLKEENSLKIKRVKDRKNGKREVKRKGKSKEKYTRER
jgi:hypothetical protein